tara:strand:+ start:443 stop:544 length:102 start_codon:yes stop_codon:yes gene_type:complete
MIGLIKIFLERITKALIKLFFKLTCVAKVINAM